MQYRETINIVHREHLLEICAGDMKIMNSYFALKNTC